MKDSDRIFLANTTISADGTTTGDWIDLKNQNTTPQWAILNLISGASAGSASTHIFEIEHSADGSASLGVIALAYDLDTATSGKPSFTVASGTTTGTFEARVANIVFSTTQRYVRLKITSDVGSTSGSLVVESFMSRHPIGNRN